MLFFFFFFRSVFFFFFFFSSRRRHTRWNCDWSSDVCSSDLFVIMPAAAIAVVTMPFALETEPLKIMGWGVHVMTGIAHWVASLPGAADLVRAWPATALVVIVF